MRRTCTNSIHFHAYAFLVLTAAIALRPLLGAAPGAALPMMVIGICHFKSLHHVFGGSKWSMVWKGALIWAVYFAMIFGTVLAIGLWSARRIG
jgi:hypothetical protein